MIRIIDDYTILLNVGVLNNVVVGNKFKIYVEGEEILDPTTKLSLGRYEFSKAEVTITKVFDKFSEAQMIERELSPTSETIRSLRSGTIRTRVLPIEKNQITPISTDFDPIIRIGDKAKSI